MPYTLEDFTPEFCQELVEQYGGFTQAADAVAEQCYSDTRPLGKSVSRNTVRRWISDAVGGAKRFSRGRVPTGSTIVGGTIGTYEAVTLDRETGKPVVTVLHKESVRVVAPLPEFPVVTAANPTIISYAPSFYISKPITYHAVISDTQIGFLHDQDFGGMEPIHDPLALDVAKQIVASVAPAGMYFIGDWMDWPTFSRWPKHPEMMGMLQPSIEAGHQELASLIAHAGEQCTKRIMIGSNHQQRPEKFILEYNMDALGVRRASDPAGWPVFSEPYLLRYDDLGIKFSGQYPGGDYFLLEDLVLTHAAPKKLEFAASVIHGHSHKLTRTTTVAHAYNGRQTYFVYDTGCLCQVGSTSNARRLLVTRVPSDRGRTDWAQGISIVSVLGGKIPKHTVDQVSIMDGTAIYQGQAYEARNRARS